MSVPWWLEDEEIVELFCLGVKGDVSGVVAGLGIAFNSTLVALALSIFVMFLLHQVQLRQERAVLDTEEFLDTRVVRQLLVK